LTSQLNLSAFCGIIGGARRGCVARVKGVLEGLRWRQGGCAFVCRERRHPVVCFILEKLKFKI